MYIKKVRTLKPGQLVTFDNHIYRVTKGKHSFRKWCNFCEVQCCRLKTKYFCSWRMSLGYYFKLVK